MRRSVLAVIALLVSGLFSSAFAEKKSEPQKIDPDGTYLFAERDTCDLFLDVYEPAEGSDTRLKGKEKPTIIYVFGGGFINGRRDAPGGKVWFDTLRKNGYRVIAIDYRLGLKGQKKVGIGQVNVLDKAIHMAVEDLFSATAYIIENAESLGVDPSNIVISGSSAGAITVLQADYELCNRTACADLLPSGFRYAGVISFSGGILSRKGKLKYEEEPSPTLFFHGTEDRLVNYKKIQFFNLGFFGSDKIVERFRKFGYTYNIIRFNGSGHEIAGARMNTLGEQFRFIETNVMAGSDCIIDTIVDDPAINTGRHGPSRKELYRKN